METFAKRNYQKELDGYKDEVFFCQSCHKENSFTPSAELEISNCSSCNHPNLSPKKISGFWLCKFVSESSAGNTFIAHHEDFPSRLFSVKTLPQGLKEDQSQIKNLEKEADIVHELGRHPCIFAGVESGEEDGEHYLALEFAEGEGLDHRLEKLGTLAETEALLLALRLLSAETHLYNCGFLFRNLHPGNILMSDQDPILFGFQFCVPLKIAKDNPLSAEEEFSFYMPPERILKEGEGPSSEIYTLGMILYHALTGKTYYSEKELEKLEIKLKGELLTLSKTSSKLEEISTDIAEIIGKMVQRLPERRYQRYHEVEHDIVEALARRF